MFTVTGKVCVLGAVFMIGLVFLWLCHVCCRNIWHAILVRLESSSRFSRILELSEINRERLRILPPAGTPMTQLAFLTNYVSSSRSSAASTQFARYNRDRLRSRPSNGVLVTATATNTSAIPESRGSTATRVMRSVPLSSIRTQTLVHQNSQPSRENSETAPPMYLSFDSVGSEVVLEADIQQSTTLTIASANSPPPSYHSTESIMSQPTSLQSHRDRIFREFPRQTSDSSETSTQSAPLNTTYQPLTLRERLQKISEQNIPSTSSPSVSALNQTMEASDMQGTALMLQPGSGLSTSNSVPPSDDLPPSYEELFGQRA